MEKEIRKMGDYGEKEAAIWIEDADKPDAKLHANFEWFVEDKRAVWFAQKQMKEAQADYSNRISRLQREIKEIRTRQKEDLGKRRAEIRHRKYAPAADFRAEFEKEVKHFVEWVNRERIQHELSPIPHNISFDGVA